METQGKNAPNNLSKQLGLQMKGSPYSMNQPLHGNAFIGAKVKAEQQGKNSFDVGGETFQVKKSAAPKFIGALIGGVAKKALVSKVAGSAVGGVVKKGLAEVGAKAFGAGSNISSLVKDVAAPKGKTGMGKALSAIGGAAKTAVSGIGEGIGGVAEGLKEKVGGGGKGAFGDKVKNYIGSLDLITNSNPDGSLRKPSDEKDESAATTISGPGDVSTVDVSSTVPMPSFNSSFDESAIPKQQANERGIIGGKDYSKDLGGPEMGGPLNKIKNMCRG